MPNTKRISNKKKASKRKNTRVKSQVHTPKTDEGSSNSSLSTTDFLRNFNFSNSSEQSRVRDSSRTSNQHFNYTDMLKNIFCISSSDSDNDYFTGNQRLGRNTRHDSNLTNLVCNPFFGFNSLRIVSEINTNITISKNLEPFVIGRESLKAIIAHLGDGACGKVVLQAMLKSDGEYILAAVKTTKYMDNNKMVLKEAEILSKLKHENVVSMLGFVKGSSYVHSVNFHQLIMEYMPIGNLLETAKKYETKILLKLLCDVSKGMEYINNQKLVHRDLACRNVFVNLTPRAKIGDFGLCEYLDDNGYYYDEHMTLGGYNISPEAIISKMYSTKSEIWAMGILCWELFYRREADYMYFIALLNFHDFDWSCCMLPQSSHCPTILHKEVIVRCLSLALKERPSFEYVYKKIQEIIDTVK